MGVDPKMIAFIEQALAAGVPHASLVGILTSRGWPERDVYNALANHYQRVTGIDIPSRTNSGASAKEAFFYLLIFATLATWTIAFGLLAFAIIDRWFPDPLFSPSNEYFISYTVSSSLAALMVAFPLYLFLSRIVVREGTANPEKLDSPIRKWLTYMALVIAASIFMGDLIAAVAYLLRGELTSRFICKSCVVLALSGGIFLYYFAGLRKTEAPKAPARFRRDTLMALLSTVLVVLIVILGFSQSGPPRVQRDLRADAQRIQSIYRLSVIITPYYFSQASRLPATLDQVGAASYPDPVTGLPFDYKPKQGSRYELCATFLRASEPNGFPRAWPWNHQSGYHCFSFDAATHLPPPPYVPNE